MFKYYVKALICYYLYFDNERNLRNHLRKIYQFFLYYE